MDNGYDLDQLRRSKEDLEQLVAQHSKSKNTHQTLPQKLENEFWKFNVDRTRLNAIQFFGQGVITYTIFVLLILPSNFLVIRGSTYFVLDFIYSILSLIVVGIALFLFWAFSRFKKTQSFILSCCLPDSVPDHCIHLIFDDECFKSSAAKSGHGPYCVPVYVGVYPEWHSTSTYVMDWFLCRNCDFVSVILV